MPKKCLQRLRCERFFCFERQDLNLRRSERREKSPVGSFQRGGARRVPPVTAAGGPKAGKAAPQRAESPATRTKKVLTTLAL